MTGRIVWALALLALFLLPAAAIAGGDDNYFSKNELQLHADFDREPTGGDIFTATFEHFSEWSYGDNFFFLDIEGEPDFTSRADTLYFEYAPRVSLDRVFDTKLNPLSLFGETYVTLQYNDSDKDFINQVWLTGLSVDFAFQPGYGWSHLSLMVRNEETQDTAWQITYCWGQPFSVAGLNWEFQGFADYWKNDETEVFLTEPQLRFPLANLVGNDALLSGATLGTELEFSHDFFGPGYGWEFNPTLFFAFTF